MNEARQLKAQAFALADLREQVATLQQSLALETEQHKRWEALALSRGVTINELTALVAAERKLTERVSAERDEWRTKHEALQASYDKLEADYNESAT